MCNFVRLTRVRVVTAVICTGTTVPFSSKKVDFLVTELDDTSDGAGRTFLTCLVGCLPTMCTVSQPTNICCDVNSMYLLSW